MTIRTIITASLSIVSLAFAIGCGASIEPRPIELTTVPPTAPAKLSEVIETLSSNSAEARITAALAVPSFGTEAVAAVPALIQNLHYEPTSDVREAAAIALGKLGSDADSAVSELINILQNDGTVNVRIAAAEALGNIGNRSAVPTLAATLYEEDVIGRSNLELIIISAKSISLITGENFLDENSRQDYPLSEEGIPLIVIAAQKWWEQEGKDQLWEDE